MSSKCIRLFSLSLSFLSKKKKKSLSCLLLYPDEGVFQRASDLLLQHSVTTRSSIAHYDKQAPKCACTMTLTLIQYRNTCVHTGCLVDSHRLTLHSKCTFSRQTCSVFHFKYPSSFFTLSCTRQLLLNTVYLHLSAIYLDCSFNLTFWFLSSPPVCVDSEGELFILLSMRCTCLFLHSLSL